MKHTYFTYINVAEAATEATNMLVNAKQDFVAICVWERRER
jgi:hypothetical protein